MTAEERGIFVAEMIHNDQAENPLSLEELESHLILALQAQAEEEREACAKVGDAKAEKYRSLEKEHLETTPMASAGFGMSAKCSEEIAAEIRARSES